MLKLKSLRKQFGLSQQHLADKLGVTQATLSGWENEKYEIDNDNLIKIADYFNVSIDYLLGRVRKEGGAERSAHKRRWFGKYCGIPADLKQILLEQIELTADISQEETDGCSLAELNCSLVALIDAFYDLHNKELPQNLKTALEQTRKNYV